MAKEKDPIEKHTKKGEIGFDMVKPAGHYRGMEPRDVHIGVRAPLEVRDKLRELSSKTDMPVSWHVIRAVREYLERLDQ